MSGEPSIPDPIFLSAPKAATLCGVSRNTLCNWIRAGKLGAYRTPGGKNLIRPEDLVDFMHKNGMFVPESLKDLAEQDTGISPSDRKERRAAAEPAVLIVDDDQRARRLARLALRSLKVPIIEADTGYKALHILVKHPEIALVILDLVMPGQHGVETLAEIRRQQMSVPVIVVTGHPPGKEGAREFGEYKPDIVIAKPYSQAYLLEVVKVFLADLGL